MNENEREVDKLLQNNVRELLSGFDWDGQAEATTWCLAGCERGRIRRVGPWATAAAFVLGIGLLIGAVVMLKGVTQRPQATSGWAKVSLAQPLAGKATVSLVETARGARGKCELIPAPPRVSAESKLSRPSWCVVVGPEPSADDRERQSDVKAIMHLL